jgi:Neocarzinostatin family
VRRRTLVRAAVAVAAAFGLASCGTPTMPTTPGTGPNGEAVTVTPSTGLVDGQTVTVRGSGYSPNASVGIIQCRAPADGFDDCSGETASSFSADGSGGFVRAHPMTRILEFGNGVEHDCAIPDSCFLVSVYIHGFQGRAAAPLHFAADYAVSAWPDTNLTDGQEIQVKGYGYGAHSSVGVIQCPTGADAIDECDGRTADSFSADADGSFTRRMAVRRVAVDAHGVETDCAVPGACVVAGMYVHGFQGLATDDLHFAP